MSDPLSQVIQLLRPSAVSSKVVSGAGRWAVRYTELGQPAFCAMIEPIDAAEAAQRMAEHVASAPPVVDTNDLQQAVVETPRPSAPAAPTATAPFKPRSRPRGAPPRPHGRSARLRTTRFRVPLPAVVPDRGMVFQSHRRPPMNGQMRRG